MMVVLRTNVPDLDWRRTVQLRQDFLADFPLLDGVRGNAYTIAPVSGDAILCTIHFPTRASGASCWR